MKDWAPVQGELVLVRDRNIDGWLSRKYVMTINLGIRPYIVLNAEEEAAVSYKQMKRLEKTLTVELTEEDAALIIQSMGDYLFNKSGDLSEFKRVKERHCSILDKINAAK